jgi:hypothetical protein
MPTTPPLDLLKPTPTEAENRNQLDREQADAWADGLAASLGIPPDAVVTKAASKSNQWTRALQEACGTFTKRANSTARGASRPRTLTVRVFNDSDADRQRTAEPLLREAGIYGIDVLVIAGGDAAGNARYIEAVAAIPQYKAIGDKLVAMLAPKRSALLSLGGQGHILEARTSNPTSLGDLAKDFESIDSEERACLLRNWRRTLCLILEGAPGVGKSHIAEHLANGLAIDGRSVVITRVQFHQSTTYEEFVRGWRPTADGKFRIRRGLLPQFARKAESALDIPHVLIIDEINRGNVAKIFGEMLSLVESTKRDQRYAVRLGNEQFHLPPNLYILGLMNTADRALAMVDFALRRRFVFWRLSSAIGSTSFRTYMESLGIPPGLARWITERYGELNKLIASEPDLGDGFQIGHSYFCLPPSAGMPASIWYADILRTQIAPLLREYSAGDTDRLQRWLALVQLSDDVAAEQSDPTSMPSDIGDT